MAKEYIFKDTADGIMVNDYLVKVIDQKVTSCDCIGFKYNRKCKHVDMVKDRLSTPSEPNNSESRFLRIFCKNMIDFFNLNYFAPNNIKFEVAGSYRREAPDSKDLDIIICGNNPEIKSSLLQFLKATFPNGNVKKLTDINARSIGNYIIQWYVPMTTNADVLMDFHLVDPENFESELLFFTGSMKHNIKMRAKAKNMGMKLNQYGLWKDDECLTKKEREIFNILNMEYKEPKDR